MEPSSKMAARTNTTHKRTANACAQCRSKKLRCDGKVPSCDRCLNLKMACRYHKRKGRGMGRSKQYIQSLERRLRDAGIPPRSSREPDQNPVLAGTSDGEDVPHIHTVTATGVTQAFTSTWPNEITETIAHAQQHMDKFERKVFVPLLSREYIAQFISHTLEDLYHVRPLFNTNELLELVDEQYAAGRSDCHDDPTRWATLNTLIAICIQWKADNRAIKELFPLSWAYFKNAYAIFPELMIKGASIGSCRAMLIMALFIKGTADAMAFTGLLSAAAHAAQCIGPHLQDVHAPGEITNVEKYRRMFWLIHVLRCDASMKYDLPSTFGEAGVDLPYQETMIGAGTSPNLLKHMSTLSLIQSRISRHLHPASALWNNHGEMHRVLVKLDNDLAIWLSRLPSEFRPTAASRMVVPGVAEINFAYYAATWRIHTASNSLQGSQDSPTSGSSLRLVSPTPIEGARAIISLLQRVSPQPLVVLWQFLCYPVCAALTLIAAALADPKGSEAQLNIIWVGEFVKFLQDYQNREDCDLKRLVSGCSALCDIALSARHSRGGQSNEYEESQAEISQEHKVCPGQFRSGNY
ncbi:hypothetical protein EDB82DRAFT_518471 [Fusarium venenatum]|uniref:uncharacterized protein n=1 Tax=Fusarium venenatum TaxID=56646 RepID=UPI001E1413D0|nr:hypothetical protein EDB82DRAFT_518471 [Fusarium venenatum]